MKKVKVSLQPIVRNINLPTVLKTTVIPGDSIESLFIATQVGKIFYISRGVINTFLDIQSQIIKLGTSNGGYDERGLLGLAFHPSFYYNGIFYLHYSVAGTQGPGALSQSFEPNPCNAETLNLQWTNRDTQYDHIDTVEEWIFQQNGQPTKRRTLLNLRRPFMNHNGVNSLNFSPETGRLILTTGDGGSGYDPFNLSQNNMEICGKIIEIDVNRNTLINNPPVVTRFNELPTSIQETLTIMAKGVRNMPGISFQRFSNRYIKYVGNVGQDLVESIFSFANYRPLPVTQLVQSYLNSQPEQEKLINFGWRGWEGIFPTSLIGSCSDSSTLNNITTAYYYDAAETSAKRIHPLACYFHKDSRSDKFEGSALTGVQPYMGKAISDLTGSVVFTDFAANEESKPPLRGVLAYTKSTRNCKLNDYSVIEVDYDFGADSSYYVCLGTNMNQSRLYLGVYGSSKVTDFNKGTIFEIFPS